MNPDRPKLATTDTEESGLEFARFKHTCLLNVKESHMMRAFSKLLLVSIFSGLTTLAQAAVILEIDVSDPSAVIFTPTAAFSEVNASVDAFDGITLLDFFTGNTTVLDETIDSGTINVLDAGTAGRSPLTYIFAGPYTGGWTFDDLSFYEPLVPFTQQFSDQVAALSGGAIHDLTGLGALPVPGTIGTLITGAPDDSPLLVIG